MRVLLAEMRSAKRPNSHSFMPFSMLPLSCEAYVMRREDTCRGSNEAPLSMTTAIRPRGHRNG